jgi:glycosyltransferase involved in cell wall biosynthesis
MGTVSVVLVTLNEERNIDRCLGSVRWADEIVVVDSFSSDRTVERARTYTEKVYRHEYPGYSRQIERGIGYATGKWILLLDADEKVSAELAREIQDVVRAGRADQSLAGCEILRRPQAFGKWIEHGGWFPDYQFRFFRKDSFVPEHQEVHGGFTTKGKRGRLQGIIEHYTYETIFSYVSKMNDYTSLQVSNKLSAKPDVSVHWYTLVLSPLSHFLRMFVSRKGYRDGFHGFILALLDATYTLLLYAKIWEYRMRQAEGKGHLPPITNSALNNMKHSS